MEIVHGYSFLPAGHVRAPNPPTIEGSINEVLNHLERNRLLGVIRIGVMGSNNQSKILEHPTQRDTALAKAVAVGSACAAHKTVLISGETTGVPAAAVQSANLAGGVTFGIAQKNWRPNPANPHESSKYVVHTGLSQLDRNSVNARISQVMIIVAGGKGTRDEFEKACQRGCVIGVVEGTYGTADEIAMDRNRYLTAGVKLFVDANPLKLISNCLRAL